MCLVSLEPIEISGSAARCARGRETLFLALCDETAPDREYLADGDMFAVADSVDSEAGDLVVWWTGGERTKCLASVREDWILTPLAGFPTPT